MWSESVLIVSLPLLLDIIFAVLTAANKSAIIPAISPTYTAFEPCAYIPNDVKRPAISTIQNKISQKVFLVFVFIYLPYLKIISIIFKGIIAYY